MATTQTGATSQGARPPQNSENSQSIGSLEHHVHKVFASVRVPGEDFVYSASQELFSKLDSYCDQQENGESKPPLLIKGESGTGKSALLSNWLQRRDRNAVRSRSTNEEFIFWHAVGCSRQSMNVNSLLRRLIVELKTHFDLGRDIPKSQDKLRWEMPRFLDLASKRGKVLIVIDGLHRLITNDGAEDGLTWLPLELPPTVRVILTVTERSIVTPALLQAVNAFSRGTDAAGDGDSGAHSPKHNPNHYNDAIQFSREKPTVSSNITKTSCAPVQNQAPFMLDTHAATDAATAAATQTRANTGGGSAGVSVQGSYTGNDGASQASRQYSRASHGGGSAGGSGLPEKKKKRSRILQELIRRKVPTIEMQPLEKELCRSMVDAFIQKSVTSEAASFATGPYTENLVNSESTYQPFESTLSNQSRGAVFSRNDSETDKLLGTLTEGSKESSVVGGYSQDKSNLDGYSVISETSVEAAATSTIPGFLMFENQIVSLLNHQQGGTPLFLRLFLRCLQYAVSRGYSLWHLYEEWMQADSVGSLLSSILQSLEEGGTRTKESARLACDKTIAAGGVPALMKLYSWHPSFQTKAVQDAEEDIGGRGGTKPKMISRMDSIGSGIVAQPLKGAGMVSSASRKPPSLAVVQDASNAAQAALNSPGGGGVGGGRNRSPVRSDSPGSSSIAAAAVGNANGLPLSGVVTQNLADQQWNTVSEQADEKLHLALLESNRVIEQYINQAKTSAAINKQHFIVSLVENIKQAHISSNDRVETNAILNAQRSGRDLTGVRGRDERGYAVKPEKVPIPPTPISSPGPIRPFSRDSTANSPSSLEREDDGHGHTANHRPGFGAPVALDNQPASVGDDNSLTEDEDSIYGTTLNSPTTVRTHRTVKHRADTEVRSVDSLQDVVIGKAGEKRTPKNEKVSKPKTPKNGPDGAKMLKAHSTFTMNKDMQSIHAVVADAPEVYHGRPDEQVHKNNEVSMTGHGNEDGAKDIHLLPAYLRGGIASTTGFGDIIGNALALLYVARQGLRESELWLILAQLQHSKEAASRISADQKEMKQLNARIVKTLAGNILNSQGELIEIFKSDDTSHTGYVTRGQLLIGLRKIYPDTKKTDITKLLEFLEINLAALANAYSEEASDDPVAAKAATAIKQAAATYAAKAIPVTKGNKVHYLTVFSGLSRLNRHLYFTKDGPQKMDTTSGVANAIISKKEEILKKSKKKQAPADGAADDDDYDNFLLPTNDIEPGFNGDEESKSMYSEESSALKAWHASITKGGDEGNSPPPALGPVIEESLLGVLVALGVLHSVENKVLILPSDNEPFRHVIYENYILNRGGCSLTHWHNLLIQHFKSEPVSMRKCEELPWHLKICRKWVSLKDALVDLKTFSLMFSNDGESGESDLKHELMEYWLLLTEGPLYVNNDELGGGGGGSAAAASKGAEEEGGGGGVNSDSDDNVSTYSHILREIDQAMANNVSSKHIRKKMYRNQIPPFDIVEEFNKAVELWVHQTHPTPIQLHKMIKLIGRFLAEFSTFTHNSPTFLRVGVDMQSLQKFGYSFEDVRHFLGEGNNNKDQEDSPAAKKSSEGNMFENTDREEDPKFPSEAMISSKMYVYLRWIWMQFPWLALEPAGKIDVAAPAVSQPIKSGTKGGGDKKDKNGPGDLHGDESGELSKSQSQILAERDNMRMLKIWNNKKSDPTVPVFHYSKTRHLAAIKPRTSVTSTLERNVEVTYNKLYEEITAPSHIAKMKLGFHNPDKYRRNFEEELDISVKTPYAYHTVKTVKMKSLFASYDASIRDKQKDKILEKLELSSTSGNSKSTRSSSKKSKAYKFDLEGILDGKLQPLPGNGPDDGPTFMLTQLDDEIRRLNNEEYMNTQSQKLNGNKAILDVNDLEHEAYIDRLARMKTISNKLNTIQHEKHRVISELANEVQLRRESDAIIAGTVHASEQLIQTLNERNFAMDASADEVKKLADGYNELLRVLVDNPPFVESHVKSLEIEVQLAQKQFEDLIKHRAQLYKESQRISSSSKKTLQEHIQYYKNARQEVAHKRKAIVRQIKIMKMESKGGIPHLHGRKFDIHDGGSSIDSYDYDYDSEASSDGGDVPKEIMISAPVMHFLNGLAKKTTGGKAVIHAHDKKIDDVVQRAKVSAKRDRAFKRRRARAQGITIERDEDDTDSSSDEDEIMVMTPTAPAPDAPPSASNGLAQQRSTKKSSKTQPQMAALMEFDMFSPAQSPGGQAATYHKHDHHIRRLSQLQQITIKKTLATTEATQAKHRNAFIQQPDGTGGGPKVGSLHSQVQRLVETLMEKTSSPNVDEFVERYSTGQKLLEALTSQQAFVDARLSQLQAEHADLTAVLNDISFKSDETQQRLAQEKAAKAAAAAASATSLPGAGPASPTFNGAAGDSDNASISSTDITDNPFGDNSDRYLDNQLFAKEVRLHQLQRLYDNAMHIQSEVRTSVSTIMNTLVLNKPLLKNLSKNPPPVKTVGENDVANVLSWCEDVIMALSEALSMDANRSNSNEDNKPMSQRQTELAAIIQQQNRGQSRNGPKKPQKLTMAQGLMSNLDKSNFVSSPRGVMVNPAGKIDKIYDNKVNKIIHERDKRLDTQESLLKYPSDKNQLSQDVHRFIQEGLDRKYTKEMSRQANLLVNKRTGRGMTYGLVLEELIEKTGGKPGNEDFPPGDDPTEDGVAAAGKLNTMSTMSNLNGSHSPHQINTASIATSGGNVSRPGTSGTS